MCDSIANGGMCDSIANGGPPACVCPPSNVIITSNLLDTTGNVIAGNIISVDGTFTGSLFVAGQVYGNIIYNSLNIGGVINTTTIVSSTYYGNGYGLAILNASNITGTISNTNLPPSGVVAGTYGSSANISQITVDQYGIVTAASNIAAQWSTVDGNVAYQNGVSIGTLSAPPVGSNLYVLGSANITDTLNVSTLYVNSATVFGSATLNVFGISNLNSVLASLYIGNGSGISNINGSNVVSTVGTAQSVTSPTQPNITSVGTLTGLTVQGLLIASNGSGISNINGSNVVGTVGTAQSVTSPAQPNITSVGTLTGLTIQGLLIASNGSGISNINGSNVVSTVGTAQSVTVQAQTNITSVGTLTGLNIQGLLIASNGSGISNLNSSNLVGNVAAAEVAMSVTDPAQPNITSVGTLTGLNIQGLLIASNGSGISNINGSNVVSTVGTALSVTDTAQPNITSVGTLTGLNIQGLLIASNGSGISNINGSNVVGTVGTALSVTDPAQPNITSVGTLTGITVQGLLIASNGSGISNINSSNLVGNVASANVAMSVTAPSQPNITSVGTLTGLTVQGLFIASNGSGISNINGSNIFSTVGTAQSVTDPAQTNITSVGTLTGLNIQGLMIASNGSGISNINGSNVFSTVGTAQSVTVPSQTNITSVGTLTGLNIQGLLIASNGSGISTINSSNLVGNVAAANVATSVTDPSQTNITSVGTLTGLYSSGNVSASLFIGGGNVLSNIQVSNLTGTLNYANTAGSVTNPAQPNITSVGTLTSLSVTGSLVAGTISGDGEGLFGIHANAITETLATANSVVQPAQPNITSVGTLTGLRVDGLLISSNASGLSNVPAANLTGTISTGVLPASGVSAGMYGSRDNVSSVTVDQYGRITAASNVATQWTSNSGNTIYYSNYVGIGATFVPTANLHVIGNAYVSNAVTTTNIFFTNTIQNTNLPVTGVTAGEYGSVSNIPQIFVDQYGRLTSVSNVKTQWTSIDANVAFGNGVSIGTLSNPPAGSNLYVVGTANIEAINTSSISIPIINVASANITTLVVATGILTTMNALSANLVTANVSNLVVSSNILAGPLGNTYLTGNLVVSGNVFSSIGTPLGEGGSLYYSLALNYTPPVYTGVLYGQALAFGLGSFSEQGSSTLVSRSANGNFRFNKPGIYNIKAIFLTTSDNITGMGIGSNVSDVTTRTDQTYVYRYMPFITRNPTEIFDIDFYATSTADYYYIDLFAVDTPVLAPTLNPAGGTWVTITPVL